MSSPSIASAYDALAQDYNLALQPAAWMRKDLRLRAGRRFKPGGRLLDVGCGAGADAIFFARQGFDVTGIDLSSEMISAFQSAAAGAQLENKIHSQLLDLNALDSLSPENYAGIYSFFAAMNTAVDLTSFAANAARLLSPGGWLLIHMLGPGSLWLWLAEMARGRLQHAQDRRHEVKRRFTLGSTQLDHYVRPAKVVYERYFAPDFQLMAATAYAVVRPLRPIRRLPRSLIPALTRIDKWAGRRRALLNWGDFFLLELRKVEH